MVGFDAGVAEEFGGDGRGGFEDAGAVVDPGVGEVFQEGFEAGAAVAVLGGEVGAAKEGLAIGSKKDAHGPATAAGGGLDEHHVDAVDIGAFFAIDFDGDERAIEDFRDSFVLEGLPFHHVAPVTGGISNGEEDGFVFGAGAGEGFFAPGEPVDGVVGVLEEVGAVFVDELVGGHERKRTCLFSVGRGHMSPGNGK